MLPPKSTKELGSYGESLATNFLLQKGYKLIARNLRLRIGEIDILLQEDDVIVVVEVKTQRKGEVFDPIFKINWSKQRKLRQLTQAVATRYPDQNIRVDGLTICWLNGQHEPEILHYENIL